MTEYTKVGSNVNSHPVQFSYFTDKETESGFMDPELGRWVPNPLLLIVKSKKPEITVNHGGGHKISLVSFISCSWNMLLDSIIDSIIKQYSRSRGLHKEPSERFSKRKTKIIASDFPSWILVTTRGRCLLRPWQTALFRSWRWSCSSR